MNTLLNDSFQGEEAASPCVGNKPDTIPEAKNTANGVSVRYVEAPGHEWYVLRASYGREVKARDLLVGMGIYAYVPQRYEMVEREGKRKKVLKSLLPNLVFAYIPSANADLYVKGPSQDAMTAGSSHGAGTTVPDESLSVYFSLSSIVSYYYNHFEKRENDEGKNPPLTVSEKEMRSFILATCTRSTHLKPVDIEKCRFLNDSLVEVVKGDYQGVKGRIARVAGQQCIVVSLANGKWNISTEYIPTPYIRVLQ